jgi:CRP/FNR family transcriptional regulator, anaerobic regulatory protein
MQDLEKLITSFFGFTAEDAEKISSFFTPDTISKGDYFLKPGQVCNTLSFQCSGLIRCYLHSGDTEITQWISATGGFLSDLGGLIFKQPARMYVQALSDTDVYTMSYENYLRIGAVIPEWHHLEKLFIARCFVFMEQRVFSLLSMNAEERYQWLFNYNPALFNQVPLQYLASMMGMTPETLSRVRRKLKL